jgi:hypothetical protein
MANGAVMTSSAILLVINLLAVMFSPSLGFSNVGDIVTNALFDEDTIESTNPALNANLADGINEQLVSDANDKDGLSFLDGLKQVFEFIINLIFLGFALIVMLYQSGAPIQIVLLIGLPTALGFYISLASFIRGFSG